MKKGFWNNFNDKYKAYFQEWFIDRGVQFSLLDFYGAYYWQNIQKDINNTTFQKYNNPQNREKFLEYLSDLLQRGELKVKINKYIHTRKEVLDEMKILDDKELIDWYNNFLQNPENTEPYNILVTDKEYGLGEYKQAIKDINERWNAIQDESERKDFENMGVVFTLPENEWMY